MLKMVVAGAEEAQAWAQRAPEAIARAVERGLERGARILVSAAKRLVYAGHPEHLEGDTGRLRQSITSEVHPNYAEVGTNVAYARIHEFGGVIEARDHALAIPVGTRTGSPAGQDDLDWAPTASGSGRLVDAAGVTQYVLARQVTIPARPTFGPALEQNQGEVRAGFEAVLREALAPAAE